MSRRELLPISINRRILFGSVNFLNGLLHTRMLNVPSPVGPPFVTWMTTFDCNAYCSFCSTHRLKQSYQATITLQRALTLADEIADAGTWVVGFTGGEVLMTPYLFEIIKRLKQRGLQVYVVTNGLLLYDVAPALVESGVDFIVVSVDFDQADEHDRNRGVPGLFDAAMRGIERLKALRVEGRPIIKTSTILTKANIHRAGEILDFLKDRVDVVSAQPVAFGYTRGPHGKEEGRMLNHIFDHVDENTVRMVFHKLAATHALAREKYFREIPNYWFAPERLIDTIPCWASFLRLIILPNGDALHCAVNPRYPRVGNVIEQSLLDVWNSPTMLRHREELRTRRNNCICWTHDVSFNAWLSALPLVNRMPVLKAWEPDDPRWLEEDQP